MRGSEITAISESRPMLFKFSDKKRFFVALSISASMIAFIAVLAVLRHQFDRNVFLLVWSGSWLYAMWLAMFVMNNGDILVDAEGLSRVIFGKALRKIRWAQIHVVREYELFSKSDQRDLRCLQIIPEKGSSYTWQLYEKMIVTEKLDRFDDFVAMLNDHLEGFHIRIEAKTNSQWEARDRLSCRQRP